MTYSPTRGSAPEYHHATPDVDVSGDPQEAALIWELRRLQKFLEQERCQERERFPRLVDLQSANRDFSRPLGEASNAPAKPTEGAVGRLLGKLGLNRHYPPDRSNSRGKTQKFARRSVRQDPPVPYRPGPAQKPERTARPSPPVKTESRLARQTGKERFAEVPQVSRADRIGVLAQGEARMPIRSPSSGGGRTLLQPRRALDGLRSVYALLAGWVRVPALAEGSETGLTARLTNTFEREHKRGLRVLIMALGVLGGWAILVPLSGAVIVPGTLVVESDLKKIQHPAGGVVEKILVRDGVHVRAGELLLHLDETQPRANAQVLTRQLDQIRVKLARLMAERDGMEQPQIPHEMAGKSGDEDVSRLWASEISLFNSRAAARRSAKELLQSHIEQLREQISGLEAQVKSKAAQHDLISGELEGVDSLYQKGLVPLTRKTSLQREAARLDGERGQVTAAIAEAKSKISEAELQRVRTDHDFRTEVMKDLREAQDKEAELVEKTIAAQDLLRRVDLRAPTNGIVHQLSVHTIGGVITPGEVVMEIVPESDELQIEAKLPPQEVDHVHHGQRAYIRFSAFNQRTTPQLEGVVSYVSADLTHDRKSNSNAAYYTVRVTIPSSERRRLVDLQLVSGMPVEVFLQTGSRTMMSYLLKPITDQLLRTFN